MDKKDKFELVDVVALDLENARLRNENTKLHDIIDRAIITLAEANPFYLAALFAARQTMRKEQENCCCNVENTQKQTT